MSFYVEAIASLKPDANFSTKDDKIFIWDSPDITQPTEEEISTEQAKLQAEWGSQAYARNRKTEYDALNQLELMSDDSINGTTTHKDAIVAIKAKWPKDNSGPV